MSRLIFLKFILAFFSLNAFPQTCEAGNLFYFTGVPKCGTHLLEKVVYYLDGMSFTHGKLFPHPDNFKREISTFKKNSSTKYVIIIRDPRDALLSAQEFANEESVSVGKFQPWDYWWKPVENNPDFHLLSQCEQVSEMVKMKRSNLIIGSEKIYSGFEVALAARDFPNVLIVRYEDLIGSEGFGNNEVQYNTLKEIAEFVGLPLENANLAFHNSWGPLNQHGFKTFRHGVMGRWKKQFNKKLIQDFKSHGRWNEFLLAFGYEKDSDW